MRAGVSGGGFDVELVDTRSGAVTFRVRDDGGLFADEAGGHRWQRIPPTEKRGRVHTSTVTVAVLSEPPISYAGCRECDVVFETTRGHGKGGQHRNKTESAVKAKHVPTGLEAFCQSERSQHQNKASALAVLRARVFQQTSAVVHGEAAAVRKAQVGSGMRGDKRRTIRKQDGQVIDHVTGRRWRFEEYERGSW